MSPDGAERSRSASPATSRLKQGSQKPSSKGFRWKDKPSGASSQDSRHATDKDSPRDDGSLRRGYRLRSPPRDSRQDRRHDNRWNQEKARDRNHTRQNERPGDRERSQFDETSRDNGRNRNATRSHSDSASRPEPSTSRPAEITDLAEAPRKSKKPKASAVSVPSEPLIIVNINDRLGTKAAIPCLASDSIRAFKAVVAAHIGRQPHEILLKRQGERPFKDQLTLEDYGVSNGVQLDLELDTGD